MAQEEPYQHGWNQRAPGVPQAQLRDKVQDESHGCSSFQASSKNFEAIGIRENLKHEVR
jgi:hypothetical protein